MKLVVPYFGEIEPLEARMIRLAEFLGIRCEALPLPKDAAQPARYIEGAVRDRDSCFVVNPRVIKQWVGGTAFPLDLASCLVSRFPHLIVHGLRLDDFDTNTVAALSGGRLNSIQAVDGMSPLYEIAKDSKDVCGAFAGLSFGPTNPINDHVLSTNASDRAVRNLISIGGRPFMAAMRLEGAEILFLASEDVADLNAEAGETPAIEYFSRLVPQAMALRHVFGDACWRPGPSYASLVIDDPLLRLNYGFLNFESLLHLMEQHDFQTTIAFIPHNFRRSSPRITRMFRENPARFGLCFHGNDHTGAEFASTDTALLNAMLHIAENRMNLHHKMTGVTCDRVMVFPQGNFSVAAMKALKSHNYYAAVNTVPHPTGQPVRLTIGELAQPAVFRYGGFPLFLRANAQKTQSHDIAFNLFFGRPILIVEHHDIFRRPESLAEVAARINSVAAEIHWSNLANVVSNSFLRRRAPDGTVHVRAYSGTAEISNSSEFAERFSIEWSHFGQCSSFKHVVRDGTPCLGVDVDDTGIRLLAELAPGSSQTFSVVYKNDGRTLKSLGFRRNAAAFLRRRLSEVRDNYLSKNPRVLATARTVQRRLLG